MTDEEKATFNDLVKLVAYQDLRITALEEALHDSGVIDTDVVREISARLQETLPVLPDALDLASVRSLLAELRIPERNPGQTQRQNRAPSPDRNIGLSVVKKPPAEREGQ